MNTYKEFKSGLKIGKYKKEGFGYRITIDSESYYIEQPKRGYWAAYDAENREYYAINDTRKDCLEDIIRGLYFSAKENF